jgi:hypothetical protein
LSSRPSGLRKSAEMLVDHLAAHGVNGGTHLRLDRHCDLTAVEALFANLETQDADLIVRAPLDFALRKVVRRGDPRPHASAIPAGADVALAVAPRKTESLCENLGISMQHESHAALPGNRVDESFTTQNRAIRFNHAVLIGAGSSKSPAPRRVCLH